MSVLPTTCAHWHPDLPSDYRTYKRRLDDGGTRDQVVCSACNRARERAKYRNKVIAKAPVVRRHASTKHDYACFRRLPSYGVLPRLMWAAPEFLTGLSHESPTRQCLEALK